jgi:peroxiredoxin
MRSILICAVLAAATLTAFQKDPMALLRQSKAKLDEQGFVSYQYTSLWPNPSGEVDTTISQCSFSVTNGKYFKYDYVMRNERNDFSFIDGALLQVNHDEKKVTTFPSEMEAEIKRNAVENYQIRYTPFMIVNMAWLYAKDTVNEQKAAIREYRLVEMDEANDAGNKIFVTLHLFINKSTKLPERVERRAFLDGKSTQVIKHLYTNYQLSKKPAQLTYTMPAGYSSEIFGQTEKLELLKEGQPAPAFTAVDIQGKPVSLESLRGKKVLLDFSVIGCGYCKLALDHLNQSNFKLKDGIVGIYLNPVDKKPKMESYGQRVHIPFTVVPDARELGKMYGVFGYPTFYLINEQGIIEKVVVGYRKEFIDELAAQ